MVLISEERELWLARNILPNEGALRKHLARYNLPIDLEIDDVVQECYSNLATKETVVDIRHPRNYLYSVARTVILKHVQKARVTPIRLSELIESYEQASYDPSPEQQVSDREQLHILALAVSKLPEPGRRAFLMRVIDELSFREIGLRLGVSDNAVQKSVTKTVQKLGYLLGRGRSAEVSTYGLIVVKEIDSHVAARE